MRYYRLPILNEDKVMQLCFERLKKAGVHPSELSSDGLKLLFACSVRDQLTASRTS
ncbi:hypothetical protein VCHA50P417_160078 [Vibrio chagasii]|nr:hypothetical protein VCHA35O142_130080 [Vibrio chagasii]CAH6982323.1 hypothetical protein VCHA50P417_160078 [Vibrio chagasii]CAH7025520.1 hypothetical protein VCHA48P442_160080 [Vibrio chagasii]CAH7369152.1 hypothetical protein VCHA48P437_70032 [Vibrio chagasii]